MTIENAREIKSKGLPTQIGLEIIYFTQANGFIEGYESRQDEIELFKQGMKQMEKIVEAQKEEIKRLREALEYCAVDPVLLYPENNRQCVVAMNALSHPSKAEGEK